MDSFIFKDIVQQQLKFKNKYINKICTPDMGVTIIIKNNKIDKIVNGSGWIEEARKKQYLKIINDCLQKYKIKDIILNINLPDIPIPGVLNFCRLKNDINCFLIPNMRFALDDVLNDENNNPFENYDLQKEYIIKESNKINQINKINKIYTSSIPHKSKVEYFKYAINNTDICDGYCNIGTCHKLVALSIQDAEKLKLIDMCGIENKSWLEHLKYKYVLYNDGNTLSDRMRLLLCTNSVIIRSKTIYEEFYTYLLQNHQNYIEYNNINELRNIIQYLENNNNTYNSIVENNNKFIKNILTYDNILLYCYYLFNGLVEE